jgi:ribosomal protein L37E
MTKVSTTGSYRIAGVYEPIEYIIETHTVCDECGSTDISYKGNAHVPNSVNGVFTIIIIVSFYGAAIFGFITHNLRICGGVGLTSLIALVLYIGLTSYVERNNNKNPKCNKCGNEHIT